MFGHPHFPPTPSPAVGEFGDVENSGTETEFPRQVQPELLTNVRAPTFPTDAKSSCWRIRGRRPNSRSDRPHDFAKRGIRSPSPNSSASMVVLSYSGEKCGSGGEPIVKPGQNSQQTGSGRPKEEKTDKPRQHPAVQEVAGPKKGGIHRSTTQEPTEEGRGQALAFLTHSTTFTDPDAASPPRSEWTDLLQSVIARSGGP